MRWLRVLVSLLVCTKAALTRRWRCKACQWSSGYLKWVCHGRHVVRLQSVELRQGMSSVFTT